MWAVTSLISASALLLVLRHFCYMGKHVSDQCFDTPASATALLLHGQARIVLRYSLINASALLLCATAPQYCTVPSGTCCAVSYSFLITGLDSPTVI